MSQAPEPGSKAKKLFRIKVGHAILGLISLGSLASLMFYSVSALAAHKIDERTLLNQEGDASAMTFVQRESFNVLLDIDEWADGALKAREVQISRALLGQRLAVNTRSGKATFDLTEKAYREALIGLDKAILGMSAVQDDKRNEYEKSISSILDEFASQTRYLSQTFEKVTRNETQIAVEDRVQAELIQAILLAIGMIAGGALGAWVALDIVRGFKIARRQIDNQRKNLDATRERLLLVQKVDARSRELILSIHDGKATSIVLSEIKQFLGELVKNKEIDVDLQGGKISELSLKRGSDSTISEEDLEFMQLRLREVIAAAHNRDFKDKELAFSRDFDGLTKLANRNLFSAAVSENMASVEPDEVTAIFLIDIDRFRDVNSSLGYESGDILLRLVANKLESFIQNDEKIARLSGDEFGLTGRFSTRAAAVNRAHELIEHLKFNTKLAGLDSLVSSSVGVAISDAAIRDPEELSRCATMAIYLAKADGDRSSLTVFAADEHQALLRTWQDEIAVRNALRAGEFVMHFQPIVSLEQNQPVGVEALIRWQRPGHGLVPPDLFLPVVNRAGLTVELGAEVIRESLAAWSRSISKAFQNRQLGLPYVSINVEVAQLEDPLFVDFVLSQATQANVPTSAIVLEVTEHTLAAGDMVLGQLEKLRANGIQIALDDFGTGYSNLGQAQKMPLDILKIDKSFLNEIDKDQRSLRMVSDVAALAKGQNLKVTAEGVETAEVADLLGKIDVDFGQGYLFSRPVSETDLSTWIENL